MSQVYLRTPSPARKSYEEDLEVLVDIDPVWDGLERSRMN